MRSFPVCPYKGANVRSLYSHFRTWEDAETMQYTWLSVNGFSCIQKNRAFPFDKQLHKTIVGRSCAALNDEVFHFSLCVCACVFFVFVLFV